MLQETSDDQRKHGCNTRRDWREKKEQNMKTQQRQLMMELERKRKEEMKVMNK